MDLIAIQRALVKLYTDKKAREQFATDPVAVGLRLGLSSADAAVLAKTPKQELEWFAGSLVIKRRGEVEKLMPATTKVVGAPFRELFQEFADRGTPDGVHKHITDASAFAAFLGRNGDKPWIADLAKFEAIQALAATTSRRWLSAWFRFPVDRWIVEEKWSEAAPPRPRRTFVVWFRFPGGPLRRAAARLPLRRPAL
jgi:hypothetical protein